MKIALFTDLQLDNKPPRDRRNADGTSVRFRESEETISKAMDKAQALGAEGWMFPGDATEHKNPPSAVSAALARLFRKWPRKWAIPGNHDGSVYEVSSSSIEPLAVSAGDGFALYQTVTFDPELRCLFIPYLHRHTEADIRALIVEALKDAGVGKIFVVMHYGPKGAVIGAANTVLQSDYLSVDVFSGFNVDHVYSGHIHKWQEIVIEGIQFHVIGSTLICNMGEREDRKTWAMFDTVTREHQSHTIEQPRRWLSIPWQNITPTEPQWQAGDIVAITGEHPRGTVPKAIIAEAIKSGALPEPFDITYESKPERAARSTRAGVSAKDGLREGLRTFAKEGYSRASEEPGQVGPATALAMDAVAEASGGAMFTEIIPYNIRIKDFTTITSLEHTFSDVEPLLVLGENGIGKSNFQAALYWAQTGELPKGLNLSEAVNREKDSCVVDVEYIGRAPEQADRRLRIRRGVKIDGKGAAKGLLTLSVFDPVTEVWDEKSLNDGGERERQILLNQILGGSAMVQRIANFSIQRDREAFIDVHPKVRKSVIGEITGQEPLKKAQAKLDKQRLEAQRALEDGKQRLAGVMAVAENAEANLAAAVEAVASGESALAGARVTETQSASAVPLAEQAAATASGAVTAAEGLLEAVPATEAPLAAAKQALASYDSAYATKQADRRADCNKASEDALAADAALSEMKLPDPAEVDRLLAVATEAEDAVVTARNKRDTAVSASAQAQAQADAADDALVSAQVRLDGLHEIAVPDVAAIEAAYTEAAANATTANEALAAAIAELNAAREKAAGITATLDRLRADLASFDGQDIGNCSRCGQPVNSAHIEAEQTRLRTEIAAGEVMLADARVSALSLIADAKRVAKDQSTEAAVSAYSALRSANLTAAEAERVSRERVTASVAVTITKAAADSAKAESVRAADESRTAAQDLDAAQQAYVAASFAHRTAADAAATAAALQERLRSARTKMAELVEAGKADKAAYEARHAELTVAIAKAEEAHVTAEGLRAERRGAVTAARAKAEAAQSAAANARLTLSEAQGAVRLAESTLTAAKAAEASLRGTIAQVEGARIEVKMLVEQAQITSLAVSLVDEFRIGLIDNALPFLEDRANYWLDKLGSGSLAVRFTTRDGDTDTLDVLADDGRPGRALDIACYSGGQCARIEMAVKRALDELRRQSVGVSLAFHAYDEPTDGLDAKGKQAFVEMVLADGGVQVITSHDDSIISAFDHSIRLVRGANDETMIEEG